MAKYSNISHHRTEKMCYVNSSPQVQQCVATKMKENIRSRSTEVATLQIPQSSDPDLRVITQKQLLRHIPRRTDQQPSSTNGH